MDVEVAGEFAVGAGEDAGEVEAVGGEGVEVLAVVEVEVEDGAVVFGRGDEDGGTAPEFVVVGIGGVEGDGLVGSRERQHGEKDER